MVTQTSSSTTASTSKTTTAPLSSSSTSSSLCMPSAATATSSSSGSPYLKPVNIVSSSGVLGVKNPPANNLSPANAALAGKKVNAPKINFVGA